MRPQIQKNKKNNTKTQDGQPELLGVKIDLAKAKEQISQMDLMAPQRPEKTAKWHNIKPAFHSNLEWTNTENEAEETW